MKLPFYAGWLRRSNFDQEKSEVLIKGFSEGFDIGYRGPNDRADESENIPFSVGSHEDMWAKIMKEVKLGRTSGLYSSVPYKNFIQSPVGLVPKAGNQTRMIFHLSFDFGVEEQCKSLNYHTPNDLCSVKYNDIDYAVRTCRQLKSCPVGPIDGKC